ncbi:hypothetical protein [Oryzihumus leptocrescens]|uniref:hypothetical protein n=1 Tax=Oryzihumus leptocrescens TaxID=297536 RepID=UPI00114E7B18|nr:hypothetical protein [Oryzihumus leptocrescens]
MNRTLLKPVGVLVALVGLLWTLQGTGVLGGSAMSGVAFWAVVGIVLIIAGVALYVLGERTLRARRRDRDNPGS